MQKLCIFLNTHYVLTEYAKIGNVTKIHKIFWSVFTILRQFGENFTKDNYLNKSIDFFYAKVYNYAYRMNIFAQGGCLDVWRK